jgi:hypothetical protein
MEVLRFQDKSRTQAANMSFLKSVLPRYTKGQKTSENVGEQYETKYDKIGRQYQRDWIV